MDDDGRLLPAGSAGEVVVRGATVFDGYENDPAANQRVFRGEWYRTGDHGVIDADGCIKLLGRLDEVINRGGEKISPREVDDALLAHEAVAEAVSFPVPHRDAAPGDRCCGGAPQRRAGDGRRIAAFPRQAAGAFQGPSRHPVHD